MNNPAELPNHTDIAALAWRIWEEEAKPEGKAEDHWRLAERQLQLLSQDSQQTESKKAGIV